MIELIKMSFSVFTIIIIFLLFRFKKIYAFLGLSFLLLTVSLINNIFDIRTNTTYNFLPPLILDIYLLFLFIVHKSKPQYYFTLICPFLYDVLANLLFNKIYGIPFSDLNNNLYQYFTLSFLTVLIFLYLFFFISVLVVRGIKEHPDSKKFYIFELVIVLISLISYIAINAKYSSNATYTKDDFTKIFIFGVITDTMLFVIILFTYLMNKVIDEKAAELNKYKYELMINTYNEICDVDREKLLKIKHDIANIINVIDNAEVKEELINKLADASTMFLAKNDILNTILVSKKKIIDENNIEFKLNILEKTDININTLDIISLFANMLDNAIEAQVNADPKYIKMNIIVEDKIRILSINSKSKKEIKKEEIEYHNYGLKIISDIVKKYDGTMDIINNDLDFTLSIEINNIKY